MTKRQLEREIEDLEHKVRTALSESDDDATTPDLSVSWRDANPETRPEGVVYDPEAQTLTYDLWEAQRECRAALASGDTDIVAFLGGYGTGKSVLGARWTIANAIRNPGSRFLAMGQSFTEARTSTFRTLFEQLPGERTALRTGSFNGPETSPIVADYNRTDHRLTLTNDTVITLGSADSWSRYAGAEFGGVWMDEPSHYETDLHDLLEMTSGRLRGAAGPKVQLWTLTGNGYNDAWEILEKRQDSTGEPLGHAITLVRASTLDNPYLDAGDIDRFERQYAGTERAEQALRGGFAAAQGLVYSDFCRETHVIRTAEASNRVNDTWRIYGYDAGWNDPRVLLELGKTEYDQLVVLDEFHETKSHVDDAIEWLDHSNKPKGKVFAEHEPTDIDEFTRAGYRATKAEKSLDPGIADVRHRLEPDSDDRVGLLVADRCNHLIQEFLGYKTEEVGTSRATDHCLDALRYAIHTDGNRPGGTSWGRSTRDVPVPLSIEAVTDGGEQSGSRTVGFNSGGSSYL